MKIVIDIPSDFYKNIERIKKGFYGSIASQNIFNAVANGTPLPKGHGNLKDVDIYKAEVYKYIEENKNSDDLYLAGCGDGAYHALHIYDCIPTIIEADRGGEDES